MSSGFVLVSDASGFVGARLVSELVARGDRVKAFVKPGANLSALRGLSPERCQIVLGEPGQRDAWFRALSQCDRVLYLAFGSSYADRRPFELEQQMVLPLKALLEAAEARRIPRVVLTGSVWLSGGTREPVPVPEDERVEEQAQPMALLHARVRELVQEALAHVQSLVRVRPAVVVGPGDTLPSPAGRLVRAYLHTKPGASLRVGRGGVSLVDLDDVVDAYIAALECGQSGETYDFSGASLSFVELVGLLSELTGLASARVEAAQSLARRVRRASVWGWLAGKGDELGPELVRAFSDRFLWLDGQKAERELGVAFRGAPETLGRTVRWFVESGALPESVMARVRLELRPA